MNIPKLAVLFPGQGAYYDGVLAASSTVYPQIVSSTLYNLRKRAKHEDLLR